MSRYLQMFLMLNILGGWQLFADNSALYPEGVSYNPEIPTLEQIVGHSWGEKITSVSELEIYLQALAKASPRLELTPYGESWEGRTLYSLVVSSRKNLSRIEEIKKGLRSLAQPVESSSEANALLDSLPTVVWILSGVHGDEISSPDATLLTAYHLAAAEGDDLVNTILQNCIVLIDPLQNPDGRARFVSYLQQTQGRWPDADPMAAEHNEVWPSGRYNHYLFDMNRDWFARTQPETRGRIAKYLEWFPQVVIDLHEMGGESTYFFGPPSRPYNPELTDVQMDWLKRLGRNNAKWFDLMKFDYFTREIFDSFYPGYGEDWPMFHGSIGMTYEQASTRGLTFLRQDQTTLHFQECVQHHFIASLATLESASGNRRQLLEYFLEYRTSAQKGTTDDSVEEFILTPKPDPNRVTELVNNLTSQGIEVRRALETFRSDSAYSYYDQNPQATEFPEGSYLISTRQPAGRLVRNLLGQHLPMDEAFLKEQERRLEKGLEQQFYDLTGWSLPLLYDIECYLTHRPSPARTVPVAEGVPLEGGIKGGRSHLAYLIPWGTISSARALAHLQMNGIRVHSSDKAFAIGGLDFPRGSLIVKVKDNPDDLHDRLESMATKVGVHVYPTDSGWVESGVNFGSRQVHFLRKPKVLLAYNVPTNPTSAGATRFLLEQSYGYPVTVVRTVQIGSADLSRYNVLILPDDGDEYSDYSEVINDQCISQLKDWIGGGGTLVTLGGASKWLTEENVGLLATKMEKREEKTTESEAENSEEKTGQNADKNEALPIHTPGAILRVSLDQEHWLTAGYDKDANVLVNSRRVFSLLQLDKGRNLAVFMPEKDLWVSGFIWEEAKQKLAGKAYLMEQDLGRGKIIAFAEDPNYRAFMKGLELLFINAVFLGPSH